ncbi:MAG: oligosaccharide flippase family protein [Firmicutes bacterium]|nr:oligosaccharide flippase family protein [Bacillota bacterium]
MFNKTRLMKNTALLTGSSLIMQGIGLVFQVWLAGRITPAGIGLFSLVMAVGSLAMTLAISGIRYACTRLVSEEIGLNRVGGVGGAMGRCLGYSLFFGLVSGAALWSLAERIGFLWVGDARAVLPLRLFSLCLPFVALTGVFSGYFTATTRVYKSAAVQIAEQFLRIGAVAALLGIAPKNDVELSCACVVIGSLVAEVFGTVCLAVLYIFDRRRHGAAAVAAPELTARLLRIALPLALSAYARSSLTTLEHLLVPRGFRSAGLSAERSLASYGVIHGMVFPILMFPTCALLALAEMLVPELTEAQVSGQTRTISEAAGSLLKMSLIFSLATSAFLFLFAKQLGVVIYGSAETGHYLRVFALIAPVMYMDMVVDGMLKGLGQMMQSMSYNILDAGVSVLLVLALIPAFQVPGYVAVIFVTELLNFALSLRRLVKVAKPTFGKTVKTAG